LTQQPEKAKQELGDIRSTAINALKEGRDLLSDMHTKELAKDIIRDEQIINDVETDVTILCDENFNHISALLKNDMRMLIKERLEFVNGALQIDTKEGTIMTITVPIIIKQINRGD